MFKTDPAIGEFIRRRARGFTLIELLTALAVLGIATTIFLQLFTASQSLAKSARTHTIAAEIAEERLVLLQTHPEWFVWPNYLDHPAGDRAPVTVRETGPIQPNFVEEPDAVMISRRARNRERALYNDFTWEAFAVLRDETDNHVQVTVTVSWQLDGRIRQFALTSAVPRTQAEGVGL